MLLFLGSIIFATAAGVIAFLLLSSNGIKDFKKKFFPKNRTSLPIVTQDGKFVDSKEDLDAHLEVLETKLMEKVSAIELSKTRVQDAKESIERLHSTQSQVKKYYIKLREEIKKSEEDCKSLQEQIDDYRRRRTELDQEMKKNEVYYKGLLDAVKSIDSISTSQASSKVSMSASSSTSSFYDSSSYVFIDDKNASQKTKKLPTGPDSGTISESPSKENVAKDNAGKLAHSSPVSRSSSKSNMTDESYLQKQTSASNLDPQKEVSKDVSKRGQRRTGQSLERKTSDTGIKGQKEISKNASKRSASDQKGLSQSVQKKISSSSLEGDQEQDLELKGSQTFLLRKKLSGSGIQKLKVKSLKGEICCCGCSKCPGTCNLARCIKLGFLKPKDILSVEVAEHVDVLTGKIICAKHCTHKVNVPEPHPKRPLTPRNASRFS